MRILILANSLSGLFRFREELLMELLRNHAVYISSPNDGDVKKCESLGCVFLETAINRRGKNPFNDLKLLKKYKTIIKCIKPNVVLTFTIKPNIYGGLACQKFKIPYIVNVTGLGTAIENGGFLQKIILYLYKKSLRKAANVFFQNSSNLEFMRFKGVVINNYRLIPGSGVNLEKHQYKKYPADTNQITFVTLGRIMKDKGINELLEAAEIIKTDYPNVRFQLLGSFDEDFKEKDKLNRLKGVVECLGVVSNVDDYLAKSYATIHPSYHEGMSNVLLETAACGRPILASDVPGCRETFVDGMTGISFKPKNVNSLVSAIKEFINLPYEKKVQMGIEGRKKIESEFDRRIVVSAYIDSINMFSKGES